MRYFRFLPVVVLFSILSSCELLEPKNNLRFVVEMNPRPLLIELAENSSLFPGFQQALAKTDSIKKVRPREEYTVLFFEQLYATGLTAKKVFYNSLKADLKGNENEAQLRLAVWARVAKATNDTRAILLERAKAAGQKKAVVQIKDRTILIIECYAVDRDAIQKLSILLTSRGKISFLFVMSEHEYYPDFFKADELLKKTLPAQMPGEEDLFMEGESKKAENEGSPLLSLAREINKGIPAYHTRDTAYIGSLIRRNDVRGRMRKDLAFLWSLPVVSGIDTLAELTAVQLPDIYHPPLGGASITKAEANVTQNEDGFEVDFEFDPKGTQRWENMTRIAATSEPKKRIAIVLDHTCLTAPIISAEITGSKTSLTGNFTLNEVQSIAYIMNSKACPLDLITVHKEIIERK